MERSSDIAFIVVLRKDEAPRGPNIRTGGRNIIRRETSQQSLDKQRRTRISLLHRSRFPNVFKLDLITRNNLTKHYPCRSQNHHLVFGRVTRGFFLAKPNRFRSIAAIYMVGHSDFRRLSRIKVLFFFIAQSTCVPKTSPIQGTLLRIIAFFTVPSSSI